MSPIWASIVLPPSTRSSSSRTTDPSRAARPGPRATLRAGPGTEPVPETRAYEGWRWESFDAGVAAEHVGDALLAEELLTDDEFVDDADSIELRAVISGGTV